MRPLFCFRFKSTVKTDALDCGLESKKTKQKSALFLCINLTNQQTEQKNSVKMAC